jgi:signal peptidase I
VQTPNPSTLPMSTGDGLPKVVVLAIVVALLMAALALLAGVFAEPVTGFALTFVYGAAAIGLKRRNSWAGYGLALFLVCALVGGLLGSLRSGFRMAGAAWSTLLIVGIPVSVAVLAGRALARSRGGSQGSAIPWMVIAPIPLMLLFVAPTVNVTSSMEPTLLPGDSILIRRGGPPSVRRGDIVAYRISSGTNSIWMKRVVGIGGDRIRLEHKELFVNGQPRNEPYVRHLFPEDSYRDNFPNGAPKPELAQMVELTARDVQSGEFLVPPGKFFVLGDNRDNSLDSRYRGAVDASAIVGKPVIVYFSKEASEESLVGGNLLARGSVFSRARWNRLMKPL